nr:immunoglobulin heavy chain junction region [Mus musculus]
CAMRMVTTGFYFDYW